MKSKTPSEISTSSGSFLDLKAQQLNCILFSQLKLVEDAAIPRRREILDIEVKRQRIREQNLQKEYADAKLEHDQMTNNVDVAQMELI